MGPEMNPFRNDNDTNRLVEGLAQGCGNDLVRFIAKRLRSVVDAYMTHAGYRQLASREDLPAEIRRAALGTFVGAHERALATLRSRAFTDTELRAMQPEPNAVARAAASSEPVAGTKP